MEPLTAEELFDTLIGWWVYPPADRDIEKAYRTAPPAVQRAYDEEGIELKPIPPGDTLWYGGPKAIRWTIALCDDWSVYYKRAITRLLEKDGQNPDDWNPDDWDALWDKAVDLANAVEAACDAELEHWLKRNDQFNDEGAMWHADERGYYLGGQND